MLPVGIYRVKIVVKWKLCSAAQVRHWRSMYILKHYHVGEITILLMNSTVCLDYYTKEEVTSILVLEELIWNKGLVNMSQRLGTFLMLNFCAVSDVHLWQWNKIKKLIKSLDIDACLRDAFPFFFCSFFISCLVTWQKFDWGSMIWFFAHDHHTFAALFHLNNLWCCFFFFFLFSQNWDHAATLS